ncbi:MAG: response regulator [Candidatus Marinimicrobia bacterium]|nr:response regulator [Candidatus Neomarinimicrobiota bacterium]
MTESKTKPMILVVEDDILNRKLMTFYLREKFELCYGASVAEAKESLIQNNPKVILLDLSLLEGENGLDLCDYVQKTEKYKDIPIIAVTAHAFSKDRQICEEAGCAAYLSKPVKQNELIQMIEKHLK